MRLRSPRWTAGAMLAACAVVAPTTLLAQQPATASALFAKAQTRYRTAESLRIGFEQIVSNPLTGTKAQSRGTLLRKRPNLFAIAFTEPSTGDRIVCDGKTLWVYLPSTVPDQVIKMPVTSATTALSDPLGALLTAPPGRYRLTDAGLGTLSGKSMQKVALAPATRDPLFVKATVWIDVADGTIRRIETADQSGVERQITLTQQSTSGSVPRSAFTFTPPAKARIIDQSGSAGE